MSFLQIGLAFFILHCSLFISATSLVGRGLGVWSITGFRAFTADSDSSNSSSISFTFPNSSTTTTTCTHVLEPGNTTSIIDADNFYTCDDTNVSWKYGGGWLALISTVAGNE